MLWNSSTQNNGVMTILVAILMLIAIASTADAALAISTAFADSDVPDVSEDREPIGHLGIMSMEFNGSITLNPSGESVYRFTSEPIIQAIDREGPGWDVLKPDDVLVAIDEYLITTKRGGLLFSDPPIGEPLELTIRRDEQEIAVEIVPAPYIPGEMHSLPDSWSVRYPRKLIGDIDLPAIPDMPGIPDMPSLPGLQGIPRIPSLPGIPPIPKLPMTALPSGWLGLGLKCEITDSDWDEETDHYDWRFKKPPEIYSVDPDSPADRAGLKRGDILTHINDIRLETVEGSREFSGLESGEVVKWTFQREGGTYSASFAAALPMRAKVISPSGTTVIESDLDSVIVVPPSFYETHLRYAGTLGETGIEVRGLSQVVVTVVEEDEEILIKVGDTIIRLWDEEKD